MKAAKMNERPSFALKHQADIESVYHMQMPRWLFSDPRYADTLTLDAKVTYTLILNRYQLSKRNGWVNEYGEVFVIFPRKKLASELRICEQRITAAFKELKKAKLIWEKRCGLGNPNQIYLAKVEVQENLTYHSAPFDAPPPPEPSPKGVPAQPQDLQLRSSSACGSGNAVSAPSQAQKPMVQKRSIGGSVASKTALAENQNPLGSNIEKEEIDVTKKENSQSIRQEEYYQGTDGEDSELENILENCELHCLSPEEALVFEHAIEHLYYSRSIEIGNVVLPQHRVRAKLRRMDAMTIEIARNKLLGARGRAVKNTTKYVMATLFNAISETESDCLLENEWDHLPP